MAKPRTPKRKSNGNEELPTNVTVAETNPGDGFTTAAPAETGNTKMKNTLKKSLRKPEIVKTETRSNLFPINVEDEIRRLAYLMSERRGFEPGHETEDWLAAEHEIRERYHQQTVQTA